eukprot:scaffold776_cov102-Skeletonema_dohrnii-CCMP3373.AAC.1
MAESTNSKRKVRNPSVDHYNQINSRIRTIIRSTYQARYQNILGMLRWAVELGRMDTQHDVAAASRHLTLRDI